MKKLLWIAIALLVVVGYAACGGSGYSSPTAPGTVGTPGPGPTPTPGRGY